MEHMLLFCCAKQEHILSYVQNNCLLAFLPRACCLALIAPICDMHSTLQRNVMWNAYTSLEFLQI